MFNMSKKKINESYDPDRLYQKEYIVKVLSRAPKELRHIINKLQDIPCENSAGVRSVCTRIPEVVKVYLDGRY